MRRPESPCQAIIDKEVVYDVGEFVTGYIAQCIPAQVVESDAKLPEIASKLAVQSVDDEKEYVGSFDAVVRIRAAIERGPWRLCHKLRRMYAKTCWMREREM